MKKYILVLLLLSLFPFYSKSQNPESGWFWSLRINETYLNNELSKYDGMGWSETASGKYAFEFSSSQVTIYYDGFMGESYKSKKIFTVIDRKKIGIEDDFTLYEYNLELDEEIFKIIIKVINTNGYNMAIIQFLENINANGYFEKATYYRCARTYK